jgi:uncharacterized membrane protein
MGKGRLEAFSDGVLAIIITIMVLEMKVPHGADLGSLVPLWPVFLSYLLSFVYIGIYWNNHHHMMHTVHTVSGGVLWANLHLLLWLSFMPFTTGWMGENHFARWPAVLYGVSLLGCAIAYYVLQTVLVRHHGPDSVIAKAVGHDFKGKVSPVFYIIGIAAAFFEQPRIALTLFVLVALMWLVPDRRMERALKTSEPH